MKGQNHPLLEERARWKGDPPLCNTKAEIHQLLQSPLESSISHLLNELRMVSPLPTLSEGLSQAASYPYIQPRNHHTSASTTTMNDTVAQSEARGPHAEGMDTSDKAKAVRKEAEMEAATKEPDVDVEAKNSQASAAETEANTLAAAATTRSGTMTTDTAQTHEPVGGKEKLWAD